MDLHVNNPIIEYHVLFIPLITSVNVFFPRLIMKILYELLFVTKWVICRLSLRNLFKVLKKTEANTFLNRFCFITFTRFAKDYREQKIGDDITLFADNPLAEVYESPKQGLSKQSIPR